jgi:hypothetical protein
MTSAEMLTRRPSRCPSLAAHAGIKETKALGIENAKWFVAVWPNYGALIERVKDFKYLGYIEAKVARWPLGRMAVLCLFGRHNRFECRRFCACSKQERYLLYVKPSNCETGERNISHRQWVVRLPEGEERRG